MQLKSKAILAEESKDISEEIVKEQFHVKAVTYVAATPDEITSCMLDQNIRPLWDSSITGVTKSGDDNLIINY